VRNIYFLHTSYILALEIKILAKYEPEFFRTREKYGLRTKMLSKLENVNDGS